MLRSSGIALLEVMCGGCADGVASAELHPTMQVVFADGYQGSSSVVAGLQYAVGESQYVICVARCSRDCASQRCSMHEQYSDGNA